MIERTEELGLAARLPIVIGGQPVALRTLNLDESEEWQGKLAAAVAEFDLPSSADPTALFTAIARQPTRIMLALVEGYDVDHALGANLRQRFTQRELYAALKQMVSAEAPFVEDARSVAEAFGPQLRMLAWQLLARLGAPSPPASSTNGRSPTGDSTPTLSVVGSPKSESSSSGATASNGSTAKPRKR